MQLSKEEINLMFLALNDREGVLATDWEIEHKTNPFSAKAEELRKEMGKVRALSARLEAEFKVAA
jgi:hypothetical protein